MKSITLMAAVFAVVHSMAYSQDSIKSKRTQVTFDFANPVYPTAYTIRPKGMLEIILLNVNPYLYQVTFDDSLVSYPKQQPDQFASLFKLPDLAALPVFIPKGGGGDGYPGPNGGELTQQAHGLDSVYKTLLTEYSGIESGVKDLVSYALIIPELNKRLFDCSMTLQELKQQTSIYISDKLHLDTATTPYGITPFLVRMISSKKELINQLQTAIKELKKEYSNQTTTTKSVEEYRKFQKDIADRIAVLDKLLANVSKLQDKVLEFEKANIGDEIVDLYNKISTSRIQIRHVVYSGYSNDEVISKVTIKKVKDIFCGQEVSSFPVNAVVKGGVRIDFSTGIVFNSGANQFFDQKYSYDSVFRGDNITLADSVLLKRNRNGNVVTPSLGVFMHVYSRFIKQVNIGGTMGASVGADQKLYYHAGGCLLFGKGDRLVLGFGVSIAKSTKLDGQYYEGQIIKRTLAPASIPTETPTRIGGFLSLSWNLNLIK